LNEKKQHGAIPGHPDRYDMVKAGIYMERRGFDWDEWPIVARLCDSEFQIRQYILAFAKECLDAWEGLVPSRGITCHDFAAIAANNVYKKALDEMWDPSQEHINKLFEPPVPRTKEQAEEKCRAYQERHRPCRVTAKLKEALEQEAAAVYHEPYTTPSGCVIIPFGTAGKAVP